MRKMYTNILRFVFPYPSIVTPRDNDDTLVRSGNWIVKLNGNERTEMCGEKYLKRIRYCCTRL